MLNDMLVCYRSMSEDRRHLPCGSDRRGNCWGCVVCLCL